MEKKLYIVHCVDTEGPLDESVHDTFEMLQKLFSIKLEANLNNLGKLQRMELDLNGIEKDVYDFVRPERLNYLRNWPELLDELKMLTSNEFRNSLYDSNQKPWVFSWFIMDHVGFNDVNPRSRDIGFHKIFDKYMFLNLKGIDDFQFHFHPLAFSKAANLCGVNYISNSTFFEVLARKVLERGFFPSCYRPGFHTERPDSHWLLEQWIPFDFGNQSYKEQTGQPDLAHGRFGNWKRAPKKWSPYHPSHDDYTQIGSCRRYITRCLNIATRTRNLTKEDIYDAFKEASENGQAILSFTNHDFRKMTSELITLHRDIVEISAQFPDVATVNSKAVDAFRAFLKLGSQKVIFECELVNNRLDIKVQGKMFGPQPFFCFSTIDGRVFWSQVDEVEKNWYSFTFDEHTIPLNAVERIGVAANSVDGLSSVCLKSINQPR